MFSITGWGELLVVLIVSLMVFSPKDLPKILSSVAKWVRKIKCLTQEVSDNFEEIVNSVDDEDANK